MSRFQEKCAERMAEFRQRGTTILLITHDTRLVLKCAIARCG